MFTNQSGALIVSSTSRVSMVFVRSFTAARLEPSSASRTRSKYGIVVMGRPNLRDQSVSWHTEVTWKVTDSMITYHITALRGSASVGEHVNRTHIASIF